MDPPRRLHYIPLSKKLKLKYLLFQITTSSKKNITQLSKISPNKRVQEQNKNENKQYFIKNSLLWGDNRHDAVFLEKNVRWSKIKSQGNLAGDGTDGTSGVLVNRRQRLEPNGLT